MLTPVSVLREHSWQGWRITEGAREQTCVGHVHNHPASLPVVHHAGTNLPLHLYSFITTTTTYPYPSYLIISAIIFLELSYLSVLGQIA